MTFELRPACARTLDGRSYRPHPAESFPMPVSQLRLPIAVYFQTGCTSPVILGRSLHSLYLRLNMSSSRHSLSGIRLGEPSSLRATNAVRYNWCPSLPVSPC